MAQPPRLGKAGNVAQSTYRGQEPLAGGSAGATVAEKNWTLGGIVGARVIATFTFPLSQSIVQSPRRAFST